MVIYFGLSPNDLSSHLLIMLVSVITIIIIIKIIFISVTTGNVSIDILVKGCFRDIAELPTWERCYILCR